MRGSVIRNSPSYLPALYAGGQVGASLLAALHGQGETPVTAPGQSKTTADDPKPVPAPAEDAVV